tara:strand:- start:302 stop:757 length:456 start_codon:yes stop_codon:yes gene_type:complete
MTNSSFSRRNNLTRYSPVFNLHTDINNLFDDFLNFSIPKIDHTSTNSFAPPVEVVEDSKSYKINFELPGIKKEDVDILINDDRITVKCKKEDKQESYLIKEIYYGSYERSIKIPHTADASSADANFKDGILSININKKTESVSVERKLQIK